MSINFQITVNNAEELKEQIKSLYETMFPEPEQVEVTREVTVAKFPAYYNSNILSVGNKLKNWIEENVQVGDSFSILSARLNLGFNNSNITNAQQTLKAKGVIVKVQKGIWRRAI